VEITSKVLDIATKVITLFVAYAVVLGLTYEVAFFREPEHRKWMASLTTNDHLATTITMLGWLILSSIPTLIAIAAASDGMSRKKRLGPMLWTFGGALMATSVVAGYIWPYDIGLGFAVCVAIQAFTTWGAARSANDYNIPILVPAAAALGVNALILAIYAGVLQSEPGISKQVTIRKTDGNVLLQARLLRLMEAGALIEDGKGRWSLVAKGVIGGIVE